MRLMIRDTRPVLGINTLFICINMVLIGDNMCLIGCLNVPMRVMVRDETRVSLGDVIAVMRLPHTFHTALYVTNINPLATRQTPLNPAP